MKTPWFIVLILLLVPVHGLSQNEQAITDKSNAIDSPLINRLYNHVSYLASDELAGRKIGSQGLSDAFDYSEKIFVQAELKPLFTKQNPVQAYRQPITIIERSYELPSDLLIENSKGRTHISPDDFRYFNLIDDSQFRKDLPLVFLGYGISEPAAGWDEISSMDLRGKVAVVRAGAPSKEAGGSLPDSLVVKHESVNGTINRLDYIARLEKHPEGIILIINDGFIPIWPNIRNAIRQPAVLPGKPLPDRLSLFPVDLLLVKPEAGAVLLNLQDQSTPVMPAKTSQQDIRELIDTHVKLELPHRDTAYRSWNLGGYSPGSDPVLRNEYIVVGAHLDHLGVKEGGVMNGADDNASGCAALYELAGSVNWLPHKRSLAFILWTGEESEALGSQQFLANPPIPLDKIKCYINFDMIGRVAPENEASGAIYLSTPDQFLDSLKTILTDIQPPEDTLPVLFTSGGLSDHFAFSAKQILSFSFYSGHHADVHKPTDDIEKLDFTRMGKVIHLAEQMILFLSNQ